MLKNFVYNDCTDKCRSDSHGSHISSVITLRSVSDNQLATYIYCICANCGHVLDKSGRSALHVAAACGKKQLCKWLITSAKADINLKDKESGYTPLHNSIFYGQLDVTVLLAKHGANLTVMDNEEMRPIDHLIRDRKVSVLSTNQFNEVYIWGRNANYNLGTGSQQARDVPELLDSMKRISIKQVCLEKFHSVFLSEDGRVWSCGHGQGGRLGLGSESSVVSPKKLMFEKDKDKLGVAMMSTSQDHSVFLMQSGSVFVCGLNCYHQLGLSPPPPYMVSPTPIRRASLRPQHPLIGVACGQFHSVVYSTREVFTWGIHAGQLGHSNITVTSASVIEPRVIADLPLKERDVISEVVACNTATVISVNKSEIYVYYQFEYRKFSPFNLRKRSPLDVLGKEAQTIEQTCVAGGRFKTPHPPCLPHYEGEDLKVAILTNHGNIYLWTESCAQFTRCVFINLRYTAVRHFVLQSNHLGFVSTDGQTFLSLDLNIKHRTSTSSTSLTAANQKKSKGEYLTAQDLVSEATYTVRVERLANVHRATKVISDPKGYNFCVLQFRPLDYLLATDDIPRVTSSSFQSQLSALLTDASECDVLHDVVFQVGATRFPAHKYILASRCRPLYELCSSGVDAPCQVTVDNVQPDIFKQILLYVYTNDCDMLHSGQFKYNCKGSKQENVLKLAVECATRFQLHDLVEKLKLFKFENRTLVLRDPSDLFPPSDPLSPSSDIPCFDRHCCQELCDVAISSCDGALIKAHKCVLAGRLEYFQHMLSGGWIEAGGSTPLQLPMPGSVLHEVINFLYTNSTSKPVSYDSVEYWANLLVVADQLFIERLKQCCELGLTYSLSLKNAVELFGFAVTYNAPQLKKVVMSFIVLNMCSFIESRSLEGLSDSLMKELIEFYKTKMDIAHRVITPCSSALRESMEDKVMEIARNHPNPWKDSTAGPASDTIKPAKCKPARPGTRRRRKSTLSEDESSGVKPLSESLSEMLLDGMNVSSEEYAVVTSSPKPLRDNKVTTAALPAAVTGEKWTKIQKQQKSSIDATLRVMSAVKESPDLLDLEHNFTRVELCSSLPITIPSPNTRSTSILASSWTPPPSLEDASSFPILGLAGSRDTKSASKSSDQPSRHKPSSRSSRGEKFNKKLNLTDLADHLNKSSEQCATPPRSVLPSSSVWGSTATDASPWSSIEHNSSSPTSLKDILRETKLETSQSGGLSRSDKSFSEIIADEIKKKDNFVRMTSKCLDFIQLEDRAIQELKLFYNVENSFEERLTISRVLNNDMDKPMWISGKQIQSP
uniref:Inhibitor of Bruton tyrosine kinase n=3 Tax=Cacopsylla melanoneura TaxID=428564 RepID=A0A8D8PS67_9HEMI